MLDQHDHHFMCISTMIIISCPCTIMLLVPSSYVLLCLTQFTWHNGISNLVSLITKTKLGLSHISFATWWAPLRPCGRHLGVSRSQRGAGGGRAWPTVVLPCAARETDSREMRAFDVGWPHPPDFAVPREPASTANMLYWVLPQPMNSDPNTQKFGSNLADPSV
jgi:hypothetical protein